MKNIVETNNRKLLHQKRADKVNRHALCRLSVGVASVAISSTLFFTANSAVTHAQAESVSVPEPIADTHVGTAGDFTAIA